MWIEVLLGIGVGDRDQGNFEKIVSTTRRHNLWTESTGIVQKNKEQWVLCVSVAKLIEQ
jgi:hypothetical protein